MCGYSSSRYLWPQWCSLKWRRSNSIKNKRCKIWRYDLADFEKANYILESFNWSSIFNGDIEYAWNKWKDKFCFSDGILHSTKSAFNLPWLNSNIRSLMRDRNRAYKRAKKSQLSLHWKIYKRKRNKVADLLKRAKTDYFSGINLSDSKSFWKATKVLLKRSMECPFLTRVMAKLSQTM